MLFREFSKYFVVGGLAFSVDFLLFISLVEVVGIHYLVANIFGFAAGLVVNYVLCIRWVFHVRTYVNVKLEFLVFALVGLFGLLLGEVVLFVLVESFYLAPAPAKLLMTAVVFMTNFLFRKLLLFSALSPDADA